MSNFTQIHLIHQQTQARTVVHVGESVGRSASEISLGASRLRLRPLSERAAQVEITEGDAVLTVDGKPKGTSAQVRHGGVIEVEGQDYRLEVHGWREEGRRPPRITSAWICDTGPVRNNNQDAIGILKGEKDQMYIVADGVSNSEAGDVVSKFAVQYLLAEFHDQQDKKPIWQEVLRDAFVNINAQVRLFAEQNYRLSGSTLTAVIIQGWDAHVTHVGDTRLYHWTPARLQQMTTDHATYVDGMEDTGKKALLTRCIGKEDDIDPEQLTVPLAPGDKLLMISDGIGDQVSDEDLYDLMLETTTEDLPKVLVDLANERGNQDNQSVIVVEIFEAGTRILPIPVPAMARAFIGYDPLWIPILQTGSYLTRYPAPVRGFGWLVAGAAILALLLLGALLWLLASGPNNAANAALTATTTALQGAAQAADVGSAGGAGSGGAGEGGLSVQITGTAGALMTQFAENQGGPALANAITGTAGALMTQFAAANPSATPTPTQPDVSALAQPSSTLRPLPTVTVMPTRTRIPPTATLMEGQLPPATATALPPTPSPTCTLPPVCICATPAP